MAVGEKMSSPASVRRSPIAGKTTQHQKLCFCQPVERVLGISDSNLFLQCFKNGLETFLFAPWEGRQRKKVRFLSLGFGPFSVSWRKWPCAVDAQDVAFISTSNESTITHFYFVQLVFYDGFCGLTLPLRVSWFFLFLCRNLYPVKILRVLIFYSRKTKCVFQISQSKKKCIFQSIFFLSHFLPDPNKSDR